MSLKGSLETFQLASLLQLLSNDQKTGVLRVTDSQNEAKIFIKGGIIVYASSSQEELRIGHFLIKNGAISKEDLHRCLQLAKDSKKKVGAILVREGHISVEILGKTLHHQVQEILYSLFGWKTGQFEFKDVPLNVEGKLVTKMNTMEIVLEASRRIDEWSVIREQIPGDALIFRISEKTQDKKEVKLNKPEWRILSLIDGTRTVRQIIDQSGLDEFPASKCLCSLYLSGLIEKDKKEQKKREAIDYATVVNVYIDILRVIHKDLQAQLGDNAFSMFENSKAELLPEQRDLFKDFDVRREPKANVRTIVAGMNAFKDSRKGGAFLTHSLNALLQLLLEKEVETLGFQLARETSQEIRRTLSYVLEYQKGATETERIVRGIENILDEVVTTN
jgi:hypothetical protein